jgi:hypothetical protein
LARHLIIRKEINFNYPTAGFAFGRTCVPEIRQDNTCRLLFTITDADILNSHSFHTGNGEKSKGKPARFSPRFFLQKIVLFK